MYEELNLEMTVINYNLTVIVHQTALTAKKK